MISPCDHWQQLAAIPEGEFQRRLVSRVAIALVGLPIGNELEGDDTTIAVREMRVAGVPPQRVTSWKDRGMVGDGSGLNSGANAKDVKPVLAVVGADKGGRQDDNCEGPPRLFEIGETCLHGRFIPNLLAEHFIGSFQNKRKWG
jgi:hypothetical protein